MIQWCISCGHWYKGGSENEKHCNEEKKEGRLSVLRAGDLGLVAALALGRKELGENVGEDTTLGDDDRAEELVQLLVVADGELKVTGNDTRLRVVTGGVASKLENLSGEV